MRIKTALLIGLASVLPLTSEATELTEEQGQIVRQAQVELWGSVYEKYSHFARAASVVNRCDRPDLVEEMNARILAAFTSVTDASLDKLSSLSGLSSLSPDSIQTLSRNISFGLMLNLTTYQTGYAEALEISLGMNRRFVDVDYISGTYCMSGVALATELIKNHPLTN